MSERKKVGPDQSLIDIETQITATLRQLKQAGGPESLIAQSASSSLQELLKQLSDYDFDDSYISNKVNEVNKYLPEDKKVADPRKADLDR